MVAQTPLREPREVAGKGERKRGNSCSTEELWAGEGGRGGGAGSGRHIAGTAVGEGCRASIRVHAYAQTRMAACWAPHQRPSVGTGRTALPSIRACSGIEAMTCLATPRHRVVDRSRIAFSIKSLLETDPIPAAYSAISFSRAKARETMRLVTQRYKTAGTSAGAAVFVPLECIFCFRGCPCRPCRRRNSRSCEWVCRTYVHHERTARQERE